MLQARSESGIEGPRFGGKPTAGLGCENPPRSVPNPPPNGRRRAGQLLLLSGFESDGPCAVNKGGTAEAQTFVLYGAKVFSFCEPDSTRRKEGFR
jgi:hypothetical protein